MKKKKQKAKSNWGIPKNAIEYFDPHYDDAFKVKHPILYFLTVIVIALLVASGPVSLFVFLRNIKCAG